jgi:hypothetical protein
VKRVQSLFRDSHTHFCVMVITRLQIYDFEIDKEKLKEEGGETIQNENRIMGFLAYDTTCDTFSRQEQPDS